MLKPEPPDAARTSIVIAITPVGTVKDWALPVHRNFTVHTPVVSVIPAGQPPAAAAFSELRDRAAPDGARTITAITTARSSETFLVTRGRQILGFFMDQCNTPTIYD